MLLDLSPDQFRALGYRAVDMLAEQLAAVPDAPCRRALPEALRRQILEQPLPEAGESPETLLEAVAAGILPYPMGNGSPRFFAWVNSPAGSFRPRLRYQMMDRPWWGRHSTRAARRRFAGRAPAG